MRGILINLKYFHLLFFFNHLGFNFRKTINQFFIHLYLINIQIRFFILNFEFNFNLHPFFIHYFPFFIYQIKFLI